MHEALVCFAWIWTSGFQTNGGGKAELCSLWECLMLGATPVPSLKEGEAPVSISPHPRQCPAPPPHNLTNIKSRHGTKTPPISSAVRAPLSAQCILQGFLLLLSLNLSLSRWMASGTYAPPPLSIGIGLGFVGSSHVMLLTATTTQLPLWQTRI